MECYTESKSLVGRYLFIVHFTDLDIAEKELKGSRNHMNFL